MNKRGRVLRDANSGAGLISANGQQYEFKLEEHWRSDFAPTQNMIVEITLDNNNKLISIIAVSESQLAKEQADKAIGVLKEKGSAAFEGISERVGTPVLIAVGALIVSWFFLDTIAIQITKTNSFGMSFWKMLGIANSDSVIEAFQRGNGGSTGLYGFLAVLALIGPFMSQFWKSPTAHLGNCLPLALMLVVGIGIYMNVQDGLQAANEFGSYFGGGNNGFAQKMMNEMMTSFTKAIHFGIGAYISVVMSLFLAFIGLKKYLAANASL